MSASYDDKISYLRVTKDAIRREIIAKGVDIDDRTTFRAYADKIRNIPIERQISELSLTASSNKEYDAGKTSAYTEISVDVKANTKTKTISKPGIYDAKDDECEGYSEVTVNISSNLTSLTIDTSNLGEKAETQTFKIEDEQKEDEKKDLIAYDEVTVDLSGKFQSKEVEVDPSNFGDSKTYNATDDDLYGYSSVKVTILELTGPFTVKFWVDRNLKDTVSVEKYGTAYYKGDIPKKDGKMFVGWDPEPINVTHNMDCYAMFDNEQDIVDSNNNILVGWKQIAADGGANVPIGGHKRIHGKKVTYDGVSTSDDGWSATCTKVYSGEDGTTSTWAFQFPMSNIRVFTASELNTSDPNSGPYTQLSHDKLGYHNSDIRNTLLRRIYESMIGDTSSTKTSALARAIKPVHKVTYMFDSDTSCPERGIITHIHNFPSVEQKLFVPAIAEANKTGYGYYENDPSVPKYTGASSTFYRTSSLSCRSNFNGYTTYGEPKPYDADVSSNTDLIIYEFNYFIRPAAYGSTVATAGYAYVNKTYDDNYASAHSGTKYSRGGAGGFDRYTETVSNITVCFCT